MMNKIKTLATTTALAAMLTLGAQGANATTIEINCSTMNFTESTSCISPVPMGPGGNVTAATMDAFGTDGAFGYTGWKELDQIGSIDQTADLPSTQTSSSQLFSFTFSEDFKSGSWSLNPLFAWGEGVYAFAIKGATDNAVYLMDTSFTSGIWSMADVTNRAGKNPELSNVRLFGTADLSPIPLPAAGWLLLMGIGGLGVASRRRKAQKA